jgi:hypothetical protein
VQLDRRPVALEELAREQTRNLDRRQVMALVDQLLPLLGPLPRVFLELALALLVAVAGDR